MAAKYDYDYELMIPSPEAVYVMERNARQARNAELGRLVAAGVAAVVGFVARLVRGGDRHEARPAS